MRAAKRGRVARALCAAAHGGVCGAHVLLSRHALRLSRATPAQLAALHAASTALALAFWTLFGLFRLRSISVRALLPSAFARALQSILHGVLLSRTSLAVYVAVRLFPLATTSHAAVLLVVLLIIERVSIAAVAFVSAFILASMLCAKLAATRLRTLFASELQLSVLTRALSAALLLPLAVRDGMPSESSTPILCISALLSFASFVSTRAMLSLEPARTNDGHGLLMSAFVPLLLLAALEISDGVDVGRVLIAIALFVFTLHALRARPRRRASSAEQDAPRWAWSGLQLAHIV